MYCRGNPIKYSDPSGYQGEFPGTPNGSWENLLTPSNLPADPQKCDSKGPTLDRIANPNLPNDYSKHTGKSKDVPNPDFWNNKRLNPNQIYQSKKQPMEGPTPPESNTPPVNNDNFRHGNLRRIEFVNKIIPFLKKSPGGAVFYYIFETNTKPAY